jgi:hypothetical protein
VVLVRRANIAGTAEAGRGAEPVLRQALSTARLRLRPSTGALLVGIREEEVVAIRPAASTESFETVKAQARDAAAELPDFMVGAGRRHAGVDGICRSYAEAQEAVSIGVASGLHGQFLAFSDVLLDRIVRSTRYADDLLDETVRPLHAYDAERRSELVRTLQVYFATRFSLTRSAAQLNVQPNTVTHRLRRIHTLTATIRQTPTACCSCRSDSSCIGSSPTTIRATLQFMQRTACELGASFRRQRPGATPTVDTTSGCARTQIPVALLSNPEEPRNPGQSPMTTTSTGGKPRTRGGAPARPRRTGIEIYGR